MTILVLEPFDPVPDAGSDPDHPTYEEGFEAGLAAGRQEIHDMQATLSHELVTAVSALTTTASEAERRVVSALAPLFEALAASVLPAIAREAIGLQLVEAVLDRVGAAANDAIRLHVSVQDSAAVEQALAAAGLDVSAIPDEALAPGQAVLGTGTSEDFIDFAEVQTAIQSALAALTTPQIGGNTHDG